MTVDADDDAACEAAYDAVENIGDETLAAKRINEGQSALHIWASRSEPFTA
jgi:hypothetical protein